MERKLIFSGLLMILLLVMAGCASMGPAGHKYIMRGQVLDVAGDTAYLCIGSRDGAQVGQELTAYRFARVGANPKSGLPDFRREKAGKVKIAEIVSEHFANAKILSGGVKVNDVVELD